MVWIPIAAAVALVAFALTAVGLPSATLFAALLVGVIVSIRPFAGHLERARAHRHPPAAARGDAADAAPAPAARREVKLPGLANRLGQACVGVLIGALVQPSALTSLASDWLIVLAATFATLLISLAAGALLGLHRDVDPVTEQTSWPLTSSRESMSESERTSSCWPVT